MTTGDPVTDDLVERLLATSCVQIDPERQAIRPNNPDGPAAVAFIESLTRDLAEAREMLRRYRLETPLGNQPHMIAHKADALLAKLDAALIDNKGG